jgi:hypothetical protein
MDAFVRGIQPPMAYQVPIPLFRPYSNATMHIQENGPQQLDSYLLHSEQFSEFFTDSREARARYSSSTSNTARLETPSARRRMRRKLRRRQLVAEQQAKIVEHCDESGDDEGNEGHTCEDFLVGSHISSATSGDASPMSAFASKSDPKDTNDSLSPCARRRATSSYATAPCVSQLFSPLHSMPDVVASAAMEECTMRKLCQTISHASILHSELSRVWFEQEGTRSRNFRACTK